MTLKDLQDQQQALMLRRMTIKDQIEQIETMLGQIALAIKVLQAQEPSTDE